MPERINSQNDYLLMILMAGLTAAYCWLVYLMINTFLLVVVQARGIALPFFSKVTAAHALFWQILAFASFAAHVARARITIRKDASTGAYLNAAMLHCGWLFLCLLLHAIGMLLPFLCRAYVIK